MTTRMTGRQKALAKMAALPKAVRAALKPEIVKSADEHVAMAQRLAPKDSGALRKSIRRVGGDFNQKNSRVRGVGGTVKGDPDLTQNVIAGDDEAWYARLVEFGVAATTGDANGNGARGPVPAKPYFYPTVRTLKRRTVSRLERAIRKAAKQVAGNGQ